MASNPFESQWIFGLHDPGGEQIMLAANRPGWIVFSEAVGHDPSNRGGRDYRSYSGRGIGVICRINNGYYPEGTLPLSRYYGDFSQRCSNFVAASPGCRTWIIGNEANYEVERPPLSARASDVPADPLHSIEPAVQAGTSTVQWWGRLGAWLRGIIGNVPSFSANATNNEDRTPAPDDPYFRAVPRRFSALYETGTLKSPSPNVVSRASSTTETITPALYAQCYRLCRDAIHRLKGHEQDQVLVASPAPWNNQTRYTGNERGDWVQYLHDVLELLGPDHCDGFCLHCYTHGAALDGITSEARMNAPFTDRRFQFRAYQDFLLATPISMRRLPVYITESDQVDAWTDANTGWVQAAYREIDDWNGRPGTQKIHCLALFRWPHYDRWYIEGKNGVIADFRTALTHDYRWDRAQPQSAPFRKGNRLTMLGYVNLRKTPGYVNKSADDLVTTLLPDQQVDVIEDGSAQGDGLLWWRVQLVGSSPPMTGWLAQFGPDGVALVELLSSTPAPTDPPSMPVPARFKRGQKVQTTTIVNARKSPGYLNKPADDVLQQVAVGTTVQLTNGPQVADSLVWWQGTLDAGTVLGWLAESSPDGAALLDLVDDTTTPAPPVRFKPGDRAMTVAFVRLRHTPGYMNKPADDVVADIWQGTVAVIVSGPKSLDELSWWEVETQDVSGNNVRGWMAESAPGGVPLLGEWTAEDRTPFKVGDLGVVGSTPVRVRQTPGFLAKPDSDVLGQFEAHTSLYMQ